jgi:hypothetical protein
MRLVDVPEDVGGDGIEAHRFCHFEAGAPVLAGNAGVVHFAGDDAEGLAVEEELAVFDAEGVGRRSLCRLRGCGKGEESEDEGGKKSEGVSHGMVVARDGWAVAPFERTRGCESGRKTAKHRPCMTNSS